LTVLLANDMKQNPIRLTGAVLLALAPLLAAAQGAPAGSKKLYCWNENGRKVCGDALPPSAVNRARTEISAKSGMATGQVERALTAEELAAAAAQAEAEKQKAAAAEAASRRDYAMAESYATEADLRRAFEERILLLEETVKASQLGVSGLRQSLMTLLRQAGEAELDGKPVRPALADNIRRQHAELMRLQAMLAQQHKDRSEIEGEFNTALERYRALKKPAATPGGTV
jgi:hypothetical protein